MGTDRELLLAYAAHRDAEAFRALVERHAAMVYGICWRVTRHRADAEDASQETFLDLARRAGRIRDNLPGWLHRVAYRRAVDRTRARPREVTSGDPEALPVRAGDPGAQALIAQVDRALADLPEDQRTVIVQRYLEGRTQQVIAAELGISQPTVHRRLEAGLASLRRRLGALGVAGAAALSPQALAAATEVPVPAATVASLGKLTLGVASAKVAAAGGIGALLTVGALAAGLTAAGFWWWSGADPAGEGSSPGDPAAVAAEAPDDDPPPVVPAESPELRELVVGAAYADALAAFTDARLDRLVASARDPDRPAFVHTAAFVAPDLLHPDDGLRWGARIVGRAGEPLTAPLFAAGVAGRYSVIDRGGERAQADLTAEDLERLAVRSQWWPSRLVFAAGLPDREAAPHLALACSRLERFLGNAAGRPPGDPADLALAETALFHARAAGARTDGAFATLATAIGHLQDRQAVALRWAAHADAGEAADPADLRRWFAGMAALARGQAASAGRWMPWVAAGDAVDLAPDSSLAERVAAWHRRPLRTVPGEPDQAAAGATLTPVASDVAIDRPTGIPLAHGRGACDVVVDLVALPQHPTWNREPAQIAIELLAPVETIRRGRRRFPLLAVTVHDGGRIQVGVTSAAQVDHQTWPLIDPGRSFGPDHPLRLRCIAADGEAEIWLDERRLFRGPLALPEDGWRLHLTAQRTSLRVRDARVSTLSTEGGDRPPSTPLLDAVIDDDGARLGELLGDADPRTVTLPGARSLLHLAAWSERDRALAALLADGRLAIDARDETGATPLALAVRHCAPRAAQRLLAAGADTTTTDAAGWMPIDEAVVTGSQRLLGLLLAAGVDPAAPNARGEGLSRRILQRAGDASIAPAVARLLTGRIPDDPWLAMRAATVGLGLATEIDEPPPRRVRGPDWWTDPVGPHATTLLHHAVEQRNHDLAVLLLERTHADVDAAAADGQTPLHWAVDRTRDPAMIARLLAHGADPHRPDHAGTSPLDLARAAGFAWAVAVCEPIAPGGEATEPGPDTF